MGNGIWQSGTNRRTGSWVLYINKMANGKGSWEIMNRLYSCTLISREQGERDEGWNDGWIKD